MMDAEAIDRLRSIKTLPSLVKYLRDKLGWRIETDDYSDLVFEYTPEELGIDSKVAAKIQKIEQLRPIITNQAWGIFFIKFEPKRLPVVALRRILRALVIKKRASANHSEHAAWARNDLLFISAYGKDDQRQITFAHFAESEEGDLPTLRVLGWDDADTAPKLDHVHSELTSKLRWPDDESDIDAWRKSWASAFTLRHREVITTAKRLAARLAELAGAIRKRVNAVLTVESQKGPLRRVMKAFQDSLIHDLTQDGFADMYAQTITYGLLSAKVSRPAGLVADDAAHMVPNTNPFLRELMEEFLRIGGRRKNGNGTGIDFDELGVNDVVELLREANMEAVLRDFGRARPGEDPVIHFYEDFMKAYDARERVRRGVYYTPKPVVSYIVRSVDELLREEFGLPLGLADTTTWGEMAARFQKPDRKGGAPRGPEFRIPDGVKEDDPFVVILDPAVGTGTFLVEVIDLVHMRMRDHWLAAGHMELEIAELWDQYVADSLLPRLYGFELMMAPYAICHMKVGLKLAETGYRFRSSQRLRVYLTNSLEPPMDLSEMLEFVAPFLAHEARAAFLVKSSLRPTAVIGNPPYSGLSANMGPWIDGLLKGQIPDGPRTASYYHVDGEPLGERNPKWLQDDYVKFMRLSQWLLEETGHGIHGFITNHGYLDNPTFRGMRWSLISAFDTIHVLDLHGNLKKKEVPPGGGKDVNVFDIQQGVAIGIFARRPPRGNNPHRTVVRHADLWGDREAKYRFLVGHAVASTDWYNLAPSEPFYLFEPFDESEVGGYYTWPAINRIMPVNSVGIVTSRDEFVIDIDKRSLFGRIDDFAHGTDSHGVLRARYLRAKDKLDIRHARRLLSTEPRLRELIYSIMYRPFDARWICYHDALIERRRADIMPHMLAGKNVGLIFMRQVALGDTYSHFGVSRIPVDNRAFYSNKGIMSFAPLYLYPDVGNVDRQMFEHWAIGKKGLRPNLDPAFVREVEEVTSLSFRADGGGDLEGDFGPEDVLAYIYAVFHSPEYRRRFDPMLKLDFPRVPPPVAAEPFVSLVRLGRELLPLHLMESSKLDKLSTTYTGPRNPEVGRVGWSDEAVWLDAAKTNAREGHRATKPGTFGFHGVPEQVWDFHVGGYQVCHKWLKDRKGRTLSKKDITHYQKIVVALSETIRIMAEIDKVIEAHGGWPGAFVTEMRRVE